MRNDAARQEILLLQKFQKTGRVLGDPPGLRRSSALSKAGKIHAEYPHTFLEHLSDRLHQLDRTSPAMQKHHTVLTATGQSIVYPCSQALCLHAIPSYGFIFQI